LKSIFFRHPSADQAGGGVSRPGFGLDGEDNGLERDKETGRRGQKQAGFDVHTIS